MRAHLWVSRGAVRIGCPVDARWRLAAHSGGKPASLCAVKIMLFGTRAGCRVDVAAAVRMCKCRSARCTVAGTKWPGCCRSSCRGTEVHHSNIEGVGVVQGFHIVELPALHKPAFTTSDALMIVCLHCLHIFLLLKRIEASLRCIA